MVLQGIDCKCLSCLWVVSVGLRSGHRYWSHWWTVLHEISHRYNIITRWSFRNCLWMSVLLLGSISHITENLSLFPWRLCLCPGFYLTELQGCVAKILPCSLDILFAWSQHTLTWLTYSRKLLLWISQELSIEHLELASLWLSERLFWFFVLVLGFFSGFFKTSFLM